ncbi:hypothetical protein LPJ64_005281 [Coemansia asiatica]|uniref:FANCL UBC-like domain-containing protein n=1 Tax=Coemansia asiatica TaxID=1052880 RepID=A0A9W7XHG5_9FUNG|nr:hypothetical protein LPJ64_005281 [Coemansia asiatica]
MQICVRLSDSWNLLDQVDKTLCVLHPQHPKRTDLSRRIAVSDLATALFEVSPERYYPKIVVYGPKSITTSLNAKAKNIKNLWSSSRSARDNLQEALGIRLPEPQSFDQNDIRLECGICLSYDLDGDNPDQICTNDIYVI